MNVLAVVPARGGSRGVPGKNVHPLRGRPLIAYTIEAARRAKRIHRLVVSTDDAAIAEAARSLGAEVVDRPAELASATAPTELALAHAIQTLQRDGFDAGLVVTLEPTSPLRRAATVDRCIELALGAPGGSVMTVVEVTAPLGRLVDGRFDPLVKGQARRRQDREPFYAECGVAYVTPADALLAGRSVVGDAPLAVVVPADEATDINTIDDFAIAEGILALREGARP